MRGQGIVVVGRYFYVYFIFGFITSTAGLDNLRLFIFILLLFFAKFFCESTIVGEPNIAIFHHHGPAFR